MMMLLTWWPSRPWMRLAFFGRWQHMRQSWDVPWFDSEKLPESAEDWTPNILFKLKVEPESSMELTPELEDFALDESSENERESKVFSCKKVQLLKWLSFLLTPIWCSSWLSSSWDPIPESWLQIEALLSNLGRSVSCAPSVSSSESFCFIALKLFFVVTERAGRFLRLLGRSGTQPFLIFQHFAQYLMYGLFGVRQLKMLMVI